MSVCGVSGISYNLVTMVTLSFSLQNYTKKTERDQRRLKCGAGRECREAEPKDSLMKKFCKELRQTEIS